MEAELPDFGREEIALESVLKELDAAYVELPEFREEAAHALKQLQQGQETIREMYEQRTSLGNRLEATKRTGAEIRAEEEELIAAMKTLGDETVRNIDESARAQERIAGRLGALADVRGRVAAQEAIKAMGADWTGDQLVQKGKLEELLTRANLELDNERATLASARQGVSLLLGHLEAAGRERVKADKEAARLKEAIEAARTEAAALNRTKEQKNKELRVTIESTARWTTELKMKSNLSDAGARDVHDAQLALAAERAVLDRGVDDIDELRSKARRLRVDLDNVMGNNVAVAKELAEVADNIRMVREDEGRIKKTGDRSSKLAALAQEKIGEEDKKCAEAESKRAVLASSIVEADGKIARASQEVEIAKTRLMDSKREAEVLVKSLIKAEDKVKAAHLAIAFQQGSKKNVSEAMNGYKVAVRRLRLSLEDAVTDRDKITQELDEAGRAYFAAVEGLKLQELQAAALQKGIEEAGVKQSAQASLYETLKADRNAYSKQVSASHNALAELRTQFKAMSSRIDALKSSITSKDQALVKEHFEHHRVEKEKETLKGELARLSKAITSCEHISGVQEAEVVKLNRIIGSAEEESGRQRAELTAVSGEKGLLAGQLVKRDGEMAAIYEKLRVQKSMLANGAVAFAKRVAERDALAAKVAASKGELLLVNTAASDSHAFATECARVEEELHAEEAKQRALLEALEKPMNLHRWRGLADRDPEKWSAIQKVHGLQRRVLATRAEISSKEAELSDRRDEAEAAKAMISKLPPPEDAKDAIAALQAALKQKGGQATALEVELDAARLQCEELKREMARLQEAQDGLTNEWVRKQKMRRKTGVAGTLSAATAGAVASLAEEMKKGDADAR